LSIANWNQTSTKKLIESVDNSECDHDLREEMNNKISMKRKKKMKKNNWIKKESDSKTWLCSNYNKIYCYTKKGKNVRDQNERKQ